MMSTDGSADPAAWMSAANEEGSISWGGALAPISFQYSGDHSSHAVSHLSSARSSPSPIGMTLLPPRASKRSSMSLATSLKYLTVGRVFETEM
jgi:hypothetical protein